MVAVPHLVPAQHRAVPGAPVLRVRHLLGGPAVLGELARRPSRTAAASSGSSKSVKYCHGVDAAHSSPMNSMGVNADVITSAAPMACCPGVSSAPTRSPTARLPIWSWVCR